MLVIGLTGGIGSGKSTVADLFAKKGIPVIDADIISKELTQAGTPACMDIIDHFEEELIRVDGSIDRARLRKIIFAHPEQRQWLEDLLHPLILEEMEKRIKQLDAPYCLAVIPLLFESGPHHFLDRTLLVDTPEHLQLERVVSRDESSHTEAKAIIDTQAGREHRQVNADDIVSNDGKPEHLHAQVDKLHEAYLRLSSRK